MYERNVSGGSWGLLGVSRSRELGFNKNTKDFDLGSQFNDDAILREKRI